jgi:hypothetical protein
LSRRRLFAVARDSPFVVCTLDRRHIAVVDVDLLGRREIEWLLALQIRLEETQPLGALGTEQLLDRLKLDLIVVVLRRNEFLKRLAVSRVLDVLADGLDQQGRPIVSNRSAMASRRSTRYSGDWK